MKTGRLLKRINSPSDLENLSYEQLDKLAEEIRNFIIKAVETSGGHMASNLGIVELTIALHRVFNSPEDKIVWDVGHQCYPHKILTGRKSEFEKLRQLDGLSGFIKSNESEHDIVDVGHASTSISYGLGLAIGLARSNQNGRVIAVLGDGALTGGMALEALNHASHIPNNLIIILNDNAMSISKNIGGISTSLTHLASTKGFITFERSLKSFVTKIPLIGKPLSRGTNRLKRAIKAYFYKENFFTSLGLKYVGPVDGHNIEKMEKTLNQIAEIDIPVLLHAITLKGKGHQDAEDDPSGYHGVTPSITNSTKSRKEKLTDVFTRSLMNAAEKDDKIVAITAAMAHGTGLQPFSEKYPERFFDVGIAEGHGVTFAAGLALAGMKPVVAIYSTFMQRAVDQIIHDVAIPKRDMVFVLDRAGLVPGDGETHQGIFDIALFKSVPDITIIAPANGGDLELAIEFALNKSGPVVVRYSKMATRKISKESLPPYELGKGYFVTEKSEKPLLIVSLGCLLEECESAVKKLEKEKVYADLYNLRFGSKIDDSLIELFGSYQLVIFVEEGIAKGGAGEAIGVKLANLDDKPLFNHMAVPEEFPPQGSREELIKKYGLDRDSIANKALELWQEIRFKKIVGQVREDKWESRTL